MSIVDFVIATVGVGLVFSGVLMEVLGSVKARKGQPFVPPPCMEQEVFGEDEYYEDVIMQDGPGFHGRHHCSVGGKS